MSPSQEFSDEIGLVFTAVSLVAQVGAIEAARTGMVDLGLQPFAGASESSHDHPSATTAAQEAKGATIQKQKPERARKATESSERCTPQCALQLNANAIRVVHPALATRASHSIVRLRSGHRGRRVFH